MNIEYESPLVNSWGSDYFIVSIEEYERLKKEYLERDKNNESINDLFVDYYEQIVTSKKYSANLPLDSITRISDHESYQMPKVAIPVKIASRMELKPYDRVFITFSQRSRTAMFHRLKDGIHCDVCHQIKATLKDIGTGCACKECEDTLKNLFDVSEISKELSEQIFESPPFLYTIDMSNITSNVLRVCIPNIVASALELKDKEIVVWSANPNIKEFYMSLVRDKSRCMCCGELQLPGFYRTLNDVTICDSCLKKLNEM